MMQQRFSRYRSAAMCLVTLMAAGTVTPPCFAMEPPTAKQVEQYREDGTLAARTAAALRLGNHKLLPLDRSQAKGLGRPVATLPSTGEVKVLALLIAFQDAPPINSREEIDSRLFGAGVPGEAPYESLQRFYRRSSYGQLEITGTTADWYTAPYDRDTVTMSDRGRELLIIEALEQLDATGHDFTQYDNDNDGDLDYLIVIWTGPVEDWASFWWGYYTTFTETEAELDGKRLAGYSWQWESREQSGLFSALVAIHETGHALGLPDYYRYDFGGGPWGGLGGLDMMDHNYGDHNCFSKLLLGWIEPRVQSSGTGSFTLASAATAGDAVILMHGEPVTDPFAEYFMVQHRRREGNDSGYPADGLLIWHVDARLDAHGELLYDNSTTEHKLLRLMEADGFEEIEMGDGLADAGDYYLPGAVFGPDTQPSSDRHDGAPTGLVIDGPTSPLRSGVSPRVPSRAGWAGEARNTLEG